MDIISTTIYGIIQGVTEFFPISSSGHLALLPKILNIKDPGIEFDIFMHMGTALAVIVYFRSEVFLLIKELWALVTFGRSKGENKYFVLNILVSCGASLVLGLVIAPFAFRYGRMPELICINLAVFGILMFLCDLKKSPPDHNSMSDQMVASFQFKKAFIIGLAQAAAVFPGVSRSGVTLAFSRMVGLPRGEATRYSFILSLPIIIGAFIYKMPALFSAQSELDLINCLWGGLLSFFIGIVAIHFFLKLILRLGLGFFTLYRLTLAAALYYFVL